MDLYLLFGAPDDHQALTLLRQARVVIVALGLGKRLGVEMLAAVG
jgi:hypothetical protein